MQPLGDAIGGAATTALLWFILNAWAKGAGTAIVRQWGWPLSAYWLVAAVGAIGGIFAGSRRRRQKFRQSAVAARTAAHLGLA
ncbi:MAG: hypothetical protein JWM11_7258, partial [Planctomycetaceae bacterium]|nr:hypothetical protein [Planctomycetaceae bacterium]